jgi:hypothetical protein
MSGVQDESSLQAARHICLLMGEYFQIQVHHTDTHQSYDERARFRGALHS